jgi:hypothetical protein
MDTEKLEKILKITETVDGIQVKELRFKPVDNIIIGFARDMITGQPNKDYWVTCCWRLNGTLTPNYGGNSRRDLYLDTTNLI